MKLKDKVALITGGGRGIGKAVALAYAREGATLALCARTTSEVERTCREIESLKAACKSWTCDVAVEESVNQFVAAAVNEFGRIDILVNNAGVMTRPAAITALDVKKWDYTIAVNLRGPFLVTRAVLPTMIKQEAADH
jgi:3-oxoacyl-[acyl-carrier protein] reductase